MSVRDLTSFKASPSRWHALNSAEPPEERIITIGWLCMAATVAAAILVAAYAAI
jgi:hypothetical protein